MNASEFKAGHFSASAPQFAPSISVQPGKLSGTDWHDEEFRDWPPLEWPAESIKPPTPTRKAVWQIRALIGIAAVALVLFFVWLLDVEKRGDAWLFWPLFAAVAYRALWWIVEWTNYGRPKVEPFAAPMTV